MFLAFQQASGFAWKFKEALERFQVRFRDIMGVSRGLSGIKVMLQGVTGGFRVLNESEGL